MALTIDLENRKALVTGVTSGIGGGIARNLAEAGCDIVGCGRSFEDSEGARSFISGILEMDRKASYFRCDLSTPDAPKNLIRFAVEQLGNLDIVVSNAGRNVFKGIDGCEETDWQECMDLDLASHWRLAKAAKPYLDQSRHGVFQIISSNHAFQTIPGCFPYNAAKAALVAMTQSLAIEWGPQVRAICLAPGFVDTPGNDSWFNSFPDPEQERSLTIRKHPVGRLGNVNDIGAFCAFLASDFAAFASGCTYLIDGGRSALLQ